MTYADRTSVSAEKSRAEIEKLVRRYGATGFAYAWSDNAAQVAFAIIDRRVRFTLTMPNPTDREFTHSPTGRTRTAVAAEQVWEQACRSSWRALALVVKAKLEAVESGISTVEQEFLAWIVLPDGSTVGERAIPAIETAYETGKVPAMLAIGDGR